MFEHTIEDVLVKRIATSVERYPRLFRMGVKAYGIKGFKLNKSFYKLYESFGLVPNKQEIFGKEFNYTYMFDLQCLQTKTRERGIGTYTIEFLKAVIIANPDILIVGFFTNCTPPHIVLEGYSKVANIQSENFQLIQINVRSSRKKVEAIKAIQILKEEIEKFNPNIVFSMSPFENIYSVIPISTSRKYLKVSMFYDAIPLAYPKDLLPSKKQRELYTWQLKQLLNSDFVFSISDYSTEVILKLGLNRERVLTVGGGPRSFMASQPISAASNRSGVLCITAEQKHKNLVAGIRAYSNLSELLRLRHPLLIVGIRSNGFRRYILKEAKKNGIEARILPYISDVEMCLLLSECRVLLVPSFAEGLSLPVLDALNHNLLVLGSKGTVVDEILNSPNSTFDPESFSQIGKVLTSFLEDDELWESTLNLQKKSVTSYTWSATARAASEKLTNLILDRKTDD